MSPGWRRQFDCLLIQNTFLFAVLCFSTKSSVFLYPYIHIYHVQISCASVAGGGLASPLYDIQSGGISSVIVFGSSCAFSTSNRYHSKYHNEYYLPG